jgi:glutaminyl-peptide cyclotransferase
LILAVLLAILTGIAPAVAQDNEVEALTVEVLDERPHDPAAFTQGLIWHEGYLYESTGQYGQSTLRQVDPESGEVLLAFRLPQNIFAEGLALVEDYLYQITWREQVALRVNLTAFTEAAPLDVSSFDYEGEGWGLCYDGELIYMSDGSDRLALRDPASFEVVEERQIMLDDVPLQDYRVTADGIVPLPETTGAEATPAPVVGRGLDQLNELECVGESIYANVWYTDLILRIDKASGAVTGIIDVADLLTDEERMSADVLNGIAYLPESETFLITGKYSPKNFEVNFVPA